MCNDCGPSRADEDERNIMTTPTDPKPTQGIEADVIGGFIDRIPNCRGCGKPLTIENAWMTDGCPCNSPLGVNNANETRWRLLMQLQQQQSHELEKARTLNAEQAAKIADLESGTMNTSNSVDVSFVRRCLRGNKFPVGFVHRGVELEIRNEIERQLADKSDTIARLEKEVAAKNQQLNSFAIELDKSADKLSALQNRVTLTVNDRSCVSSPVTGRQD